MSRTVVIIGAGRSGRGMLGELYSRSGFHIIFADKDKETLKWYAGAAVLYSGNDKSGYQ